MTRWSASTTRRWTTALAAVCLLAACVAASAQTPAAAKPLKLVCTETPLGKLPPGERGALAFSQDGRSFAYVSKREGGMAVVLNGKAGKTYEWIVQGSMVFSPDGKRLAYGVQHGEEMFVVVDEAEQKRYAEIQRPVFSADSRQVAYAARPVASQKSVAVLDGKESGEYENVIAGSVRFSPDGQLAYAVHAGRERVWILAGKESKRYDAVGLLVFSADGRRWAHAAQQGTRWRVIVDGQEGAEYERVGAVTFSPDGQRLAYIAGRKGKTLAVVDGKEGKEYERLGEPIFSPDSKRLAFMAVVSGVWMAVVDGEEGMGHDGVAELMFSGDSKSVAYLAMDDRKYRLVIGDKEGPEYDFAYRLHLSHDGSNVAYVVKKMGEKAVQDFLIFNGREIPGWANVTLSPDGRYVAHADERRSKAVLMVNETEGPIYDGFLRGSRWVFESPNRFVLLAGRNDEVLRVEVEIQEE